MKEILKDKKLLYLLGAFLILYVIMLLIIPENLDDWAWGSKEGMDRLKEGFQGYNGRYVSNIIAMGITKVPKVLSAAFCAAVIVGFFAIVKKIVEKKVLLIPFVLSILLMSKWMFTQTLIWQSGFANYVVSTAIILLYILFIKQFYDYEKVKAGIFALLIIVGFAVQFFVENVTVFFVLEGIFCLVYYFIQKRKINWYYVAALIGNVIGAAVMFINPAYHNALQKNDETYKKINISISNIKWIKPLWTKFSDETVGFWFYNNRYFMMLLCIVIIIFCISVKIKRQKGFIAISILFMVFFIYKILNFAESTYYMKEELSIDAVVYLLFFIFVIAVVCVGVKDKKTRFIMLATLFSQVPLVFPLALTDPINARCFFGAYFMFVLLMLEMLAICLPVIERVELISKYKKQILSGIVVFVMAFMVLSMAKDIRCIAYLHITNNQKLEYIKHETDKGNKKLTVPYVPFSNIYCVNISPEDVEWQKVYNLYYKFPKKTRYTYISYNDWKKDQYAAMKKEK